MTGTSCDLHWSDSAVTGTRRAALLATLSVGALLAIAAPVNFDKASLFASSQALADSGEGGGGSSGAPRYVNGLMSYLVIINNITLIYKSV